LKANIFVSIFRQACTQRAVQVCLHRRTIRDLGSGGGTFFRSGGPSARQNTDGKFLLFELVTMTSQALKYDVMNFSQHV